MADNETTTDQEHDHHDDKPSYDDINTPVVLMVGFVSIVVTILTIALVQGIYNHWRSIVEKEVIYSKVDARREAMVDEQTRQLNANDKGRIAIEEAMQKTLDEYRNEEEH